MKKSLRLCGHFDKKKPTSMQRWVLPVPALPMMKRSPIFIPSF